MTGVLICFLIGCLLHDSLCKDWTAIMPQSLEALSGSCLIIPCSFTIPQVYDTNLVNTCAGIWKIGDRGKGRVVFNSKNPTPQSLTGTLTGNLTDRNCTTILNNMGTIYSGKYYFRIECNNDFKYNFEQHLTVSVKETPPKPTLTPATVNVREDDSVTLRCSAAVPCPSVPPTLTWTPRLADTEETLMQNQDQTKVLVSIMNFTASHLHGGQNISCAVQQEVGNRCLTSAISTTVHVQYPPLNTTVLVSPSASVREGRAVTLTCSSEANPAVHEFTWYTVSEGYKTVVGTGNILTFSQIHREKTGQYSCEVKNIHGISNAAVMLDIQFPPEILPSSDCIRTGEQISCFCDSVGKPSPKTLWKLDGHSVNQLDTFSIRQEPLNNTGLRSVISIPQTSPQEVKVPTTVVCLSRNSVGSASHHFCVRCSESVQGQPPSLPFFIIIAVLSASLLVCALVFVKRAHQKQRNNLPNQATGMSSNIVRSRPSLTAGEGSGENIYVNCLELKEAAGQQNTPSTQNPDLAALNPETPSSSTTIPGTSSDLPSSGPVDQSDVLYSTVIWKKKRQSNL